MRNFVVCDRHGEPLAKVKAESRETAEALALRRIVGAARLLEVKSLGRKDLESGLQESFKQRGLSEKSAEVAATRHNVTKLREYEAPAEPGPRGQSHDDVSRFVNRYANSERSLYEAFRKLGMDDKAARIAAEGRK